MPAYFKRNGYEGHMCYRLDLSYALEPKDPKAQAPSPTCPFIKINNVKEQPSTTDTNRPGLNQGQMIVVFGDQTG